MDIEKFLNNKSWSLQDSDLDMFTSAELSHCPECDSELDNDSYCKECDIFFGEVKWQTT